MPTGFEFGRIEAAIGALADDERMRLAAAVAPLRARLLAQRPAGARALRRDQAAAARATAADEALQEHVRRVVDAAPPLSEEQRAALAALLRPASGPTDGQRAARVRPRPEDAILGRIEELLESGPVGPAVRERLLALLPDVEQDGHGRADGTIVPSPEAMVERLQREGLLRVADPPVSVRAAWRRTIFAAMQRRLVPDGYRLRHRGRDHGDLLIELHATDPAAAPTPDRPVVPVPEDLDLAHPLVRALDAKPAVLAVSPESRPRALRLVQALAAAARQRGHTVDLAGGPKPGLRFSAGGFHVPVTVSEEDDTIDYLPDGDELAERKVYAWQRIVPERRQVPSGRLVIEVPDERPFLGRRHRWADRQRWRLEDRLGHVLAELEHRAVAQAQAQETARQAALDRRRDWEEAMSAARTAYTDAYYERAAREQVDAWQQAQAARAYAGALTSAINDLPAATASAEAAPPPDEGWSAWIDRILRYADRIDPLRPVPPLPDPPAQPTPERLKPFLDGRSPYGPDSTR
ncbi:hypothetical protein [Dactylosporangium salmoneum]|uniref:PE-PGRS family protein n=1 Tax=Dactylosporangium salmoneum TaxID=53361 RepID=A0ABP5SXS1_9ACTN